MRSKKNRRKTIVCTFCTQRFVGQRYGVLCPYCGVRVMRPKSISSLKSEAWRLFSKIVRYGSVDRDGLCTCVSCGKRLPPERVDAGHYMSRTFQSTLFDTENVHVQCKICNSGFGKTRYFGATESVRAGYEAWLRQNIDENAPERLQMKARAIRRPWTEDELCELIEGFQETWDRISNELPRTR